MATFIFLLLHFCA